MNRKGWIQADLFGVFAQQPGADSAFRTASAASFSICLGVIPLLELDHRALLERAGPWSDT
jgi:hypothetical protein